MTEVGEIGPTGRVKAILDSGKLHRDWAYEAGFPEGETRPESWRFGRGRESFRIDSFPGKSTYSVTRSASVGKTRVVEVLGINEKGLTSRKLYLEPSLKGKLAGGIPDLGSEKASKAVEVGDLNSGAAQKFRDGAREVLDDLERRVSESEKTGMQVRFGKKAFRFGLMGSDLAGAAGSVFGFAKRVVNEVTPKASATGWDLSMGSYEIPDESAVDPKSSKKSVPSAPVPFSFQASTGLVTPPYEREGAVKLAEDFLKTQKKINSTDDGEEAKVQKAAPELPYYVIEKDAIRLADRLRIKNEWKALVKEKDEETVKFNDEEQKLVKGQLIIPLSGISINEMSKRWGVVIPDHIKARKASLLDETHIPREVAIPENYVLAGSEGKTYREQLQQIEQQPQHPSVDHSMAGIRDAIELYYSVDARTMSREKANPFLSGHTLRCFDFAGRLGTIMDPSEYYFGLVISREGKFEMSTFQQQTTEPTLMALKVTQPRRALIAQGLSMKRIPEGLGKIDIRKFD